MVKYLVLYSLVNLIIIAGALPLAMRKVRPNPTYGIRSKAILSNEALWYAVNAACGRYLVAGGLIALLFTVFLFFQQNIDVISFRNGAAMTFGISMFFVLLASILKVRRVKKQLGIS